MTLVLDAIGWILVAIGWILNFSNAKKPRDIKPIIAIICFSVALVLFLTVIIMLVTSI